ncbi:Hsp20/alpha crystallin family protein [Ekhidna sp.]|uniref:Hsp20/alpha crystallin family protein n=1 Tax=Ekhidna sp. TaxID=2608089 RepID=UPI00329A4B8A
MSLIKRDFPMLNNLTDFFDDDWLQTRFANDWTPAINVIENENNFEVEMAAPGMRKEDFHVTLENGILTISGTTEIENEENTRRYTRREFTTRSFTRSFTLPKNIDMDEMKAKYDDGILRLTIAKTEKETPDVKEVLID